MATDIKIPALGESVAGGQISKWHVNVGDTVNIGDIILTLETDKVAAEVTAEIGGTIIAQLKKEGDDVEVGAIVGQIDIQDESKKAPSIKINKTSSKVEELMASTSNMPPSKFPKLEAEEPAKPETSSTKVEKEVVDKPAPLASAPAEAIKSTADQSRVTRRKMTPLRKKIAEQLVSAQRTAAILTTFNECDMSYVMEMRSKLQDAFVAKYGVKLGFMSFFVKAVVEALKSVPQLNVRVEGDEIVQNQFYDIGVAVGTEKGLIVPVLRNCDQKSFADIENDILAYAKKSKEGKIQISDLTGGVFTISNGGVYGSLLSTPIINPPQSGILGMHTIQQRPIALNGQVVIRPMMYLAVSYDHRVVDGKEAVTFLVKIKDCIENPARMLVGV
jgi:2-oxoglutarate dehydrogenase E2 component (dihydrolipoamide succinyltransferase)